MVNIGKRNSHPSPSHHHFYGSYRPSPIIVLSPALAKCRLHCPVTARSIVKSNSFRRSGATAQKPVNQGLVDVPFWGFWTSTSSYLFEIMIISLTVGWCLIRSFTHPWSKLKTLVARNKDVLHIATYACECISTHFIWSYYRLAGVKQLACKSYMYIYLSMYMNAPVNIIQRLSLFGI